MDDLGQAISCARDGFQPWTREKTRHVLKSIADRLPGARYDWDAGNESWGVVSRPGEGIAFICAKIPLIVVLDRFANEAQECVSAEDAVIFIVNDFDDHRYEVAKSALEKVFGKSLTSVVAYESLSIRDLWYATVS